MTQRSYYLHLKDGYVIGYTNYEVATKHLPRGEKMIQVATNNPGAYLFLDEKQISMNPLPTAPDRVDRDSLRYKRAALKTLFFEIFFTQSIDEDFEALSLEYQAKLEEYNTLKIG